MRALLQLNLDLPLRNGWAAVDHLHGVVTADPCNWSIRADFQDKPDAEGKVLAELHLLSPDAVIPPTFEIRVGRFVAATGALTS